MTVYAGREAGMDDCILFDGSAGTGDVAEVFWRDEPRACFSVGDQSFMRFDVDDAQTGDQFVGPGHIGGYQRLTLSGECAAGVSEGGG